MNLVIICVVLNSVVAMLLTSRFVARLRVGRLLGSDLVCGGSFVSLGSFLFVLTGFRGCRGGRWVGREEEGHRDMGPLCGEG